MARFVLVAGAWHGTWCWEYVVPFLEARGHRAEPAELPGMGADRTPFAELEFGDWASSVAQVVSSDAEPAILVGHSRGGIVISQAAELVPDHVRLNIYVSGILMRSGECGLDSAALVPPATLQARSFELTDDKLAFRVMPELASSYKQSPPHLVDRALTRMTPEPRFALVTPISLSPDRYGRVPRAYVECLADETVPLSLQRAMQAREPCNMVRTLDTDHCPTYSAPHELAVVLHDLAEEVA
jgi:pimeloyl-ACP methyl ester carboxylesterase